MNERIKYLREKCLSSKPEIFVERAILVTEAYKETTGKPIIIQRALALKKVLEEMTIFIEKGELIVGNQSPKFRYPPIYPENGPVAMEVPDKVVSDECRNLGKKVARIIKYLF